jgi:hypothetical protein
MNEKENYIKIKNTQGKQDSNIATTKTQNRGATENDKAAWGA